MLKGWYRQAPPLAGKRRQPDFYLKRHSRQFYRQPNYQPVPKGLVGFEQNQRRATGLRRQSQPDHQQPRHQRQLAIPTGRRRQLEYHQAALSERPLICWLHQRRLQNGQSRAPHFSILSLNGQDEAWQRFCR